MTVNFSESLKILKDFVFFIKNKLSHCIWNKIQMFLSSTERFSTTVSSPCAVVQLACCILSHVTPCWVLPQGLCTCYAHFLDTQDPQILTQAVLSGHSSLSSEVGHPGCRPPHFSARTCPSPPLSITQLSTAPGPQHAFSKYLIQ